jgi:hypothetical protein
MKKLYLIAIPIMLALASPLCSDSRHAALLVGTWTLTGDECDAGGHCRKEIITDEDNVETFTHSGLFISKNIRNKYALKGDAVYLASEDGAYTDLYAKVVSIDSGTMLLRFRNTIRRYARAKKE